MVGWRGDRCATGGCGFRLAVWWRVLVWACCAWVSGCASRDAVPQVALWGHYRTALRGAAEREVQLGAGLRMPTERRSVNPPAPELFTVGQPRQMGAGAKDASAEPASLTGGAGVLASHTARSGVAATGELTGELSTRGALAGGLLDRAVVRVGPAVGRSEQVHRDDGRKGGAGGELEPTVGQVVHWALHALQHDSRVLEGLAARARRRGWVPSLRVALRHGQALDWVDSRQADLSGGLRVTTDQDVTLSAALTFDLPQLVFADQEIALSRQQVTLRQQVRALIMRLIAWYHERRRLLWARALGLWEVPVDPMRLRELEALLDLLTDGAFSSRIRRADRSHADGTDR